MFVFVKDAKPRRLVTSDGPQGNALPVALTAEEATDCQRWKQRGLSDAQEGGGSRPRHSNVGAVPAAGVRPADLRTMLEHCQN